MRLLLIEDERKVADFIARGLRAERLAVDIAYDGNSGWDMASSIDYDVINLAQLNKISAEIGFANTRYEYLLQRSALNYQTGSLH